RCASTRRSRPAYRAPARPTPARPNRRQVRRPPPAAFRRDSRSVRGASDVRSGMRDGFAKLIVASWAAAAFSSAGLARASDADDAVADAQRTLATATQGMGTVEQAVTRAQPDERPPEARIADRRLLLRS